MVEAESPGRAIERLHADHRRALVRTCLEHWHRHPMDPGFELDLPAVYDAMALAIFDDEARFRAEHEKK